MTGAPTWQEIYAAVAATTDGAAAVAGLLDLLRGDVSPDMSALGWASDHLLADAKKAEQLCEGVNIAVPQQGMREVPR